MATFGYSARVGLVVLIATAVFYGLFVFLRNGLTQNNSYKIHVIFKDASGLAKGVDVTMAGVAIGKVDDIELSPNVDAYLTLTIKKKNTIPAGSRFIVSLSPLADVGTLAVIPPPGAQEGRASLQPGETVQGSTVADMNSTMQNANQLMNEFHGTVGKLNKILDQTSSIMADPVLQKGLHESLVNLEAASKNGVQLTAQMNRILVADNNQVQGMLSDSRTGTKIALNNIDATTADVRAMTHENRGNLNEIVENMRDTTAAIQGITSQTNDMLKEGGMSKNIPAIMANMKATTEKLDAIAGNLEKLSADPAMQGDLKATVHNLRQTTEQTSYMIERVNHLIGVKNHAIGGTDPATSTSTPSTTPSTTPPAGQAPLIPTVDLIQNTRSHRFRADLNATVPFGRGGNFGQAGIFDLGDANRLNLEYGTLAPAGSLFDYRMGFHASKLGLGLDWGLGHSQSISADLYDPNHGHLDVHGTLMLNQNVGLLVGGDDLTKRSSAVVGLEIRK